MTTIAESTVELSEKSQAIGDIIVTVNNLAEQSNLLAVNASIEAAKAGEQGKGFNVVALEIKTLADQSKEATLQVQTVLNEIQKATSSTVMVTERGAKIAESGLAQSAETKVAIETLLNNLNDAAQASAQIAASSQQQLVGIEQIAQAMALIGESTQQSAAGSNQVETTSQSLKELSEKLQSLVGQYTV
ncbi:MAG: hypothetical protein HRT57_03475 [Crocinitomicaceae bacterium]|nr:hypothetical protein [Crocinitomicaceae bacterium]